MTLYELTGIYGMLTAALEAAETEEERDELLAQMEMAGVDIHEKCENYAKAMLNLGAEAEALKAESKRLADIAARKLKAIEKLKMGVQNAMQIAQTAKIETGIGTWSVRKNPPKCVILDAGKIPAEYLIPQPPKVDAKAIIAAYKDTGELIDGTEIVRGESVSFR